MPQRKSGIQELKKSKVRRLHNLDIKTDLRKTIKAFTVAVTNKEANAAELLKTVYKKIDKAAKRNIFHVNTADRRKSRYSKLLNS